MGKKRFCSSARATSLRQRMCGSIGDLNLAAFQFKTQIGARAGGMHDLAAQHDVVIGGAVAMKWNGRLTKVASPQPR